MIIRAVDGQYNVATAYAAGRGVARDLAQAAQWWREAAEHGHAPAQVALADAYATGTGIGRDVVEAYKWLTIAARMAPSHDPQALETRREEVARTMTAAQVADAAERSRIWLDNFQRLR